MITRAYELMIIIDSDVVDIEIPKVISRTEALITEEGGRIARPTTGVVASLRTRSTTRAKAPMWCGRS